MPVNPLQRKSRNSFLLGMLIMLLISGIVIAFIAYRFIILPSKQKEERGDEKIVYVLSQDVSSGQIITSNLLTPLTVFANMVPTNYAGPVVIDTLELKDNNGNAIYTNKNGELYIEGPSKQEIIIEQDLADGTYYKIVNNEREYIELINVPVIAKVDLKSNTVLTKSVIVNSDEKYTNDVRLQEYNMITIPTTLMEDDYIDIRLTLPSGQDYIVISKKRVISVEDETLRLELTEEEILTLNNAIVEAYIMKSSNLYATKYVEAGIQERAIPTYPVSYEVLKLINANPNILDSAKNALISRYNADLRNTDINGNRALYVENELGNIEAGIQEQIEKAKEAREKYLSGVIQ